jgi:transposase
VDREPVNLDITGPRLDVGAEHRKARVVRRIGVDEKAAAKGHRYLTLVCDWPRARWSSIAEGRTPESLDRYYAGLRPQ